MPSVSREAKLGFLPGFAAFELLRFFGFLRKAVPSAFCLNGSEGDLSAPCKCTIRLLPHSCQATDRVSSLSIDNLHKRFVVSGLSIGPALK